MVWVLCSHLQLGWVILFASGWSFGSSYLETKYGRKEQLLAQEMITSPSLIEEGSLTMIRYLEEEISPNWCLFHMLVDCHIIMQHCVRSMAIRIKGLQSDGDTGGNLPGNNGKMGVLGKSAGNTLQHVKL